MNRPFISLVVPCYNSGQYIERLLQSVVDCEMDGIEVILADDCSPEDYQDHVDKFKDKLNIKQYRMPYNSGNPTNARELGASHATGVYLSFMDHDDWWIPEGMKKWREYVEENNYPEYIVCGFRQCDTDGNTQYEKYGCLDFLHGKFFKLDEFYRKYDIHFNKDIFHKEDTWVCAQVNCNCIKYDIIPKFTDFCTYVWHNNEKSLSHSIDAAERAGDHSVTLGRISTNIMITEDIYFKFFDEGSMPMPVAIEWFVRSLIGMYFDIQYNHDCFDEAKPMIAREYRGVKKRLQMNDDEIIFHASRVFGDQYHEFMEMHQTLQFIEEFPDYIKILSEYSE